MPHYTHHEKTENVKIVEMKIETHIVYNSNDVRIGYVIVGSAPDFDTYIHAQDRAGNCIMDLDVNRNHTKRRFDSIKSAAMAVSELTQ